MQRWYISAWKIKREECLVGKIKTTLHGHNWRIWTMIVNGQWWSTTNQQANWEWFRMSDLKCLRHHQVWIWNLSQWSRAMISTMHSWNTNHYSCDKEFGWSRSIKQDSWIKNAICPTSTQDSWCWKGDCMDRSCHAKGMTR